MELRKRGAEKCKKVASGVERRKHRSLLLTRAGTGWAGKRPPGPPQHAEAEPRSTCAPSMPAAALAELLNCIFVIGKRNGGGAKGREGRAARRSDLRHAHAKPEPKSTRWAVCRDHRVPVAGASRRTDVQRFRREEAKGGGCARRAIALHSLCAPLAPQHHVRAAQQATRRRGSRASPGRGGDRSRRLHPPVPPLPWPRVGAQG